MIIKVQWNYLSSVSLIFGVFLLNGCSSNIVKDTKEISSAGVEYFKSVDTIRKDFLGKIIDDDSEELVSLRNSEMSKDDLIKTIELRKDSDDTLKLLIQDVNEWASVTALLVRFFEVLGKAVGEDADKLSQETEEASAGVITSINNYKKRKSGNEKIGDDRKKSISGLTALAVKTSQARTVNRLIKNSAEPVGKLMDYNHTLMKSFYAVTKSIEKKRLRRQGLELSTAFEKGELGGNWKSERKDWLLSSINLKNIEDSLEASERLTASWSEVVTGKGDLSAVLNNFKDINSSLQLLDQYRSGKIKDKEKENATQ